MLFSLELVERGSIIVTCMCNIHFNINLVSRWATFFIMFKKSIAFNDSLLVNTNNQCVKLTLFTTSPEDELFKFFTCPPPPPPNPLSTQIIINTMYILFPQKYVQFLYSLCVSMFKKAFKLIT